MSKFQDTLIAKWDPPKRPDWVSQVNQCIDAYDPAAVPLNADSLLVEAKRATGLEDFGDDLWHEPFHILINDLENEAQLHLIGRLKARSEILNWLKNRLLITDLYKHHPEIDDVEINRPVFILGLPRSGTTILYELMSQDERFRVLLGWESLFPCPPPEAATYATDPRIEQADRILTQINRVVPEHEALHDIGGRIPMECVQIMGHSFICEQLGVFYHAPNYGKWLAENDWAPAYNYHKKILKVLQWKNPRQHWMLKAPNHMSHIPELLRTYPDAHLLQSHRDPVKALASITSLLGTLQWSMSDRPFDSTTFENFVLAPCMAQSLEHIIALREQGVISEDAITDVRFQDIVRDPLPALAKVYNSLGLSFDQPLQDKIRDFLRAKTGASHGSHSYQDASADRIARERPLFAKYQRHYDVPNEV